MAVDNLCQVLEALAPAIRRSILVQLSRGERSLDSLATALRLDSTCLDDHLRELKSRDLVRAIEGDGPSSFGLANRVQVCREATKAQIRISLGGGEEITLCVRAEGS